MIVEANMTVHKTARQELREARQQADVDDYSYGGDADGSEHIRAVNCLSAATVAENKLQPYPIFTTAGLGTNRASGQRRRPPTAVG
jgi:hypothetical protein